MTAALFFSAFFIFAPLHETVQGPSPSSPVHTHTHTYVFLLYDFLSFTVLRTLKQKAEKTFCTNTFVYARQEQKKKTENVRITVATTTTTTTINNIIIIILYGHGRRQLYDVDSRIYTRRTWRQL